MAEPKRLLKVLVVDDNRDSTATLAMLVRLLGHEATECFDGESALKIAADSGPDLILLDLGMPGMGGLDVCRAVRLTEGGRKMMIVAQTGWGTESDRTKTKEAGFDHHLVKPVDPKILLELIGEI